MTETIVNATPWLDLARSYLGTHEISGSRDNPIVVGFWTAAHVPGVNDDETPWCAAFVSGVLEKANITSARTGWARSYCKWGQKLPEAAVGCIAVFERGPNAGHVGFVVGRNKAGQLMVLGGNQSDAVTIAPFPQSRVLSYRWPANLPLPKDVGKLPIVSGQTKLSSNEA